MSSAKWHPSCLGLNVDDHWQSFKINIDLVEQLVATRMVYNAHILKIFTADHAAHWKGSKYLMGFCWTTYLEPQSNQI